MVLMEEMILKQEQVVTQMQITMKKARNGNREASYDPNSILRFFLI